MEQLKIGEIITSQTTLLGAGETGNPKFVFSGSLNTDLYTDITSNKNWMRVGVNSYDYLFCRNQVIIRTSTIGWTGLTTEEKEIAAENFAIGNSERAEVFSDSESADHWKTFVNISQEVRDVRWKAAKGYITYKLTMPDSIDLAITTTELTNNYIVYGVESYEADGTTGLFDYLENTNTYSGSTGFSGKTYWSSEYPTNMMVILRDGLY